MTGGQSSSLDWRIREIRFAGFGPRGPFPSGCSKGSSAMVRERSDAASDVSRSEERRASRLHFSASWVEGVGALKGNQKPMEGESPGQIAATRSPRLGRTHGATPRGRGTRLKRSRKRQWMAGFNGEGAKRAGEIERFGARCDGRRLWRRCSSKGERTSGTSDVASSGPRRTCCKAGSTGPGGSEQPSARGVSREEAEDFGAGSASVSGASAGSLQQSFIWQRMVG